jgi:hypothetical protein
MPYALPRKRPPPPRGDGDIALGDGGHWDSFGRESTHAPVFRILVI